MLQDYSFENEICVGHWYKWFAWRPVKVLACDTKRSDDRKFWTHRYQWMMNVARRDCEDWRNPYDEIGSYPVCYSEYGLQRIRTGEPMTWGIFWTVYVSMWFGALMIKTREALIPKDRKLAAMVSDGCFVFIGLGFAWWVNG